jgi:hypothetical protein
MHDQPIRRRSHHDLPAIGEPDLHPGADDDLLCIIDRWDDALDDRESLGLLIDYNFGAKPLHQPKL